MVTKKNLLVLALLVCGGCGSRDDEVIRLLVSAEVAESQSIDPKQVTVAKVEILSGGKARAEAEYAPLASRGGESMKMTCQLQRELNRWHVDGCVPVVEQK